MTPLKLFPAEAPNDTNVDEVIKKATENDAGNKISIIKKPVPCSSHRCYIPNSFINSP